MSVSLSVSLSCFCHVFSNAYISAKNKDNSMKLLAYDPWALHSQSRMSANTLSSMSPVRNPQRSPSTPLLNPPFLTHF